VHCVNASTVLARHDGDALSCADVYEVRDYLQGLAARNLSRGQKGRLYSAIVQEFNRSPAAAREQIVQVRQLNEEMAAAAGMPAVELRGLRVWEAIHEQGPFRKVHTGIWSVQKNAISVWTRSRENQLALTEMDIEGWIRLGSLCREVQGGQPFRMSVSQREVIYRQLREEFSKLNREQQLARLSIGTVWFSFEEKWQNASYEEQQAWIRVTPLPPPMTASSLGYLEAVLELDPVEMSRALHGSMGPLTLKVK